MDSPATFDLDSGSLSDLQELIDTVTTPGTYRFAEGVDREVVVYDASNFPRWWADPTDRVALLGELHAVLSSGPGVFVVRHAVPRDVVEQVTEVFWAIIEEQRAAGLDAGDHFAKPGTNDRVWNVIEKLALRHPDLFVEYYSNPTVAIASLAWLGYGYQVTSQLNVVHPGGTAQNPHRDYHLGFMSAEQAIAFPPHVHAMSAMLTLQGAVAHCDMPVDSGPTQLLPHSQKFAAGYVAYTRPEVAALFESRYVQMALAAGDAMFFNPALFHAAGTNRTPDVQRMANLLQVSSAFGRAMESVDRTRMCVSVYPELLRRVENGIAVEALEPSIAACAEGYAFPTNLDRDPPVGGLAPPSQADTVRTALRQRWSTSTLRDRLAEADTKRRTT